MPNSVPFFAYFCCPTPIFALAKSKSQMSVHGNEASSFFGNQFGEKGRLGEDGNYYMATLLFLPLRPASNWRSSVTYPACLKKAG